MPAPKPRYDIDSSNSYPFAYQRGAGERIIAAAKAQGVTAGQYLAGVIRKEQSMAAAGRTLGLTKSSVGYYMLKFGVRFVDVRVHPGDEILVARNRLPQSARPAALTE